MNRSFNNLAMLLIAAALLAGCQETHEQMPEHKLTLPDDAKVVAEGAGKLSFHVPQDGRVFVYDVDDAAVLGVTHVRAGQQFVISPDSNSATLDGRKVLEKSLMKGSHSLRLCFEPE